MQDGYASRYARIPGHSFFLLSNYPIRVQSLMNYLATCATSSYTQSISSIVIFMTEHRLFFNKHRPSKCDDTLRNPGMYDDAWSSYSILDLTRLNWSWPHLLHITRATGSQGRCLIPFRANCQKALSISTLRREIIWS